MSRTLWIGGGLLLLVLVLVPYLIMSDRLKESGRTLLYRNVTAEEGVIVISSIPVVEIHDTGKRRSSGASLLEATVISSGSNLTDVTFEIDGEVHDRVGAEELQRERGLGEPLAVLTAWANTVGSVEVNVVLRAANEVKYTVTYEQNRPLEDVIRHLPGMPGGG